MSDVRCPRCGGTNSANAAFCGACGMQLPAQQAAGPADNSAAPQQQQPAAYLPPNPNPYVPPAGVPPPPPGAFPPQFAGLKVMGDNTKWAFVLGIVSLFCCGPFTALPGLFLAKKDMDEIAAGRAPQMDESKAKAAFYLNIIALCLSIFGICLFGGLRGLRHF